MSSRILNLDPSQPYAIRPYSVVNGTLAVADWVPDGAAGSYIATDGEKFLSYSTIRHGRFHYRCDTAFRKLASSNLVISPTGIEPTVILDDIYDRVVAYMRRAVKLKSDEHYYVIASYVAMSWVYQAFDSLPYLRFSGDFGSGKTTVMRAMASLSYRSVLTTGVFTPASVFRLISSVSGTYFFDEADLTGNRFEAEVTRILNSGYTRGSSVVRSGKAGEPQLFDLFGPKVIASREYLLDEALLSRCLTIPMEPSGATIESITTPEMVSEASAIRNCFLAVRLFNTITADPHDEAIVRDYLSDRRAEPRVIQLAIPLVLSTPVSHRMTVMNALSGYRLEFRQQRRESIQGQIVRAFVECGTPWCSLKDLHRRVSAVSNRHYTSHSLAIIAGRMGFYRYHGTEGPSIRADSDEWLQNLRRIYDV